MRVKGVHGPGDYQVLKNQGPWRLLGPKMFNAVVIEIDGATFQQSGNTG